MIAKPAVRIKVYNSNLNAPVSVNFKTGLASTGLLRITICMARYSKEFVSAQCRMDHIVDTPSHLDSSNSLVWPRARPMWML